MSFNRINNTGGKNYSIGANKWNIRNFDDVNLNNPTELFGVKNGRLVMNANEFNQQYNSQTNHMFNPANVDGANPDLRAYFFQQPTNIAPYAQQNTEVDTKQALEDMKQRMLEKIIQDSATRIAEYKSKYAEGSEELEVLLYLENYYLERSINMVNFRGFGATMQQKELETDHINLVTGSYDQAKAAYDELKKSEEQRERFLEAQRTIDTVDVMVNSFAVGIMTPFENIFDGLVMAGGTVVSMTVSVFDEDAASDIEKSISDTVSFDAMGAVYADKVRGIDPELAYGKLHQYSKAAGTMVGYVMVSYVGASTFSSMGTSMGMTSSQASLFSNMANGTVGAFASAGSSAENAFRNGATFDEAAKVSMIAFGAGFVSSAGLDKIGQLARGSNGFLQTTGYTLAGMGVASSEPVINSIAEYSTYGKDMVDENGNLLYENFGDYYKKSGGLLNTIIATGVGGFSTVGQAYGGYKANSSQPMDVNNNVTANLFDTAEIPIYKNGGFGDGDLDTNAFYDSNSVLNNNGNPQRSVVDLTITPEQRRIINIVNDYISKGNSSKVTLNSTTEINSAALSEITDLSKVEFRLLDGLGDSNYNLKSKYLTNPKYESRVTYSGFEMKAIISKLEDLQSKVDINLPIAARAKQAYEILASEIPVMTNYRSSAENMEVSQSLRGITSNNKAGKQGLICAGYSSVYKELCERVGIKCDYVRGYALTDPLRSNAGGGHAWNVVYTDNGMIPVDVTWKASSGNNWFGTSDEFVMKHIADADEFAKDYSNMLHKSQFENISYNSSNINQNSISSVSGNKFNSTFEQIVNTLDGKYQSKNETIKRLNNYLRTGDSSCITRDNNARALIESMNVNDLRNMVYNLESDLISDVVRTIDQKNGVGYGKLVLNDYVKNHDIYKVTRTNGARDIISSLNTESIIKYLKQYGGR